MTLSEILNETNEEVIEDIKYYKEKFEEEGNSYITSKAEKLLEETKTIMNDYGLNLEENDDDDYDYDFDSYDELDD